MPDLKDYLHKFAHLRTDRTGGWTAATQGQAPHKPILLLSILDLFAQGRITNNLIEITPELGELFATYWSKVMPPERRGNLALPFFHLRSGGFWHLLPQPGQEAALQAIDLVPEFEGASKIPVLHALATWIPVNGANRLLHQARDGARIG